ncbi:MAG: GxxExxY protein [Azospirillaceae bacterium]
MRSRTRFGPGIERLAREVVDAAYKVHRALGPGLLESAYEACIAAEFADRGIGFDRQRSLPIEYKGRRLDAGYRVDLIVEDAIVMELKSVDSLLPIHSAQLITYLRLSRKELGFLVNFNVMRIRDGLVRIAL